MSGVEAQNFGYLRKETDMRKPGIIVAILLLIVIALAVVQVMMTNILSTDGATLSNIQSEIARYKRDNALLKEEILANTSLTVIAEKAEKDGFAPSGQAYLSTPLPIAMTQ